MTRTPNPETASDPAPDPGATDPSLPETVEQFNALPARQRARLAGRMTRAQRRRLLGRRDRPDPAGQYL